MTIKKVGVIGCGLMGSGIAQVSAQAGYQTVVREVAQGVLEKGLGRIHKQLERAVEKGKLAPEDRDAITGRLQGTTALEDLADCDLVIEAIVENVEEKRGIFRRLDEICPGGAILASNTSSIPIIEMASATGRPQQVVGLHFFNPVPVMKLVEVVRGITTSDETVAAVRAFGESVGKTPILAKDRPGFIVNSLLVPYLLDAIRMLEEGHATREDIDTGMTLGCGYPMGPLTLLDFVGLDTTYYIAEIMFDEYKKPHYAPPTLLKQMVIAGYHGRKSGRGFYEYE